MAQQTAVEWLIDRLLDGSIRFEETDMGFLIAMKNGDEIEQAKVMEKEQILNACYQFSDYPFNKEDHLEYYNETYNK